MEVGHHKSRVTYQTSSVMYYHLMMESGNYKCGKTYYNIPCYVGTQYEEIWTLDNWWNILEHPKVGKDNILWTFDNRKVGKHIKTSPVMSWHHMTEIGQ